MIESIDKPKTKTAFSSKLSAAHFKEQKLMSTVIYTNSEIARQLLRRGLHTFPCDQSKSPMVRTWKNNAISSEWRVAAVWGAHPEYLPAIWPGPHGMVVIDCDQKNGKDGSAVFQALCSQNGIDLSAAFIVQTPSGGLHFYFRTDTPISNKHQLGDGIDVCGIDRYVIAPGAVLTDGRAYQIVAGDWDSIPALPEALRPLLTRKDVSETPALPIPAGPRPEASERERIYAEAALQDEINKLSSMREGQNRNSALNAAAKRMGEMAGASWIEAQTVENALWEAAAQNGYRAKDGDQAALATLRSGLTAGIASPRDPLPAEDLSLVRDSIISILCNELNKARDRAIQPVHSAEWPAPIGSQAYIGIVGEFMRLVTPHTEADPNALLVAVLTALGAAIGPGAWMQVGAERHHVNLFSIAVGETSKGRKGAIMAEAKRFVKMADPGIAERMASGLTSGEGLIDAVRDPRFEDTVSKRGEAQPQTLVDAGVSDKRLLVVESEMAQPLQAAGRDGNTLSAVLRQAWDGTALRVTSRTTKSSCKEPHVCVFGNITLEELQRLLTSNDQHNGFGNRFLWVCAKRSKLLPFGGRPNASIMSELAERTGKVIAAVRHFGACGWLQDAASLWQSEYSRLGQPESGLVGVMSSRAEPQVLRMALAYALLDGSNNIGLSHLQAALEVWRYCLDSVRYCFGNSTGDSVSDKIVAFLSQRPEGAARTEINNLFNRNLDSERLSASLNTLAAQRRVRKEKAGRTEKWFAA